MVQEGTVQRIQISTGHQTLTPFPSKKLPVAIYIFHYCGTLYNFGQWARSDMECGIGLI